MTVFTHPEFDHHEHLTFCCDPETGLRAIIAVHNTSRVPRWADAACIPTPATKKH